MQMPDVIDPNLLAPCGMNCLVCYVHLREKKPCRGCRAMDGSQPGHCRVCKIKTCAAEREVAFCSDCPDFPCVVIRRLDRSYRQRYAVSLVEDARRRQVLGVEACLLEEKTPLDMRRMRRSGFTARPGLFAMRGKRLKIVSCSNGFCRFCLSG